MFASITAVALVCASALACTSKSEGSSAPDSSKATASGKASGSDTPATAGNSTSGTGYVVTPADAARTPNELGLIPVAEYHLIVDRDAAYSRDRNHFRKDLEDTYARGYRPVTISQILDRKIDLPKGLSPIVFVFDDASPSQFSYIERNGKLEIDPNGGIGIWLAFKAKHPDWTNSAVFCLLPAADAGHAFFGNKGIDGQKTEWRFPKVKWLADQGFELCNHTLWHAQLSKYPDAFVQEQIARGQLAIDSAVPGYKVRTLALPQGLWPKNRALAKSGSWTDPKTKQVVRYNDEAVLEVAGGPTRSPYDPQFNPQSISRIQAIGNDPVKTLDAMDKNGTRYVSDGDPATVAKPPAK